tara:strand:+ start:2148 stop:4232 length:2085 start_codon:yes stop_codon:yes gene_type:complete
MAEEEVEEDTRSGIGAALDAMGMGTLTGMLQKMINPVGQAVQHGIKDGIPALGGALTVGERPTLVSPPTENTSAGITQRQVNDQPLDIADDASIMKQIFWDSQSEETQFVKLVNWLAGNSIVMLNPGVGGLGSSIAESFEAVGLDRPEIRDLNTPKGKEYVREYLRANWRKIPDLVQSTQTYISEGYGAYRGAITEGGRGEIPPGYRNLETETINVGEIKEILGQFGNTNFDVTGPFLEGTEKVPSLRDAGEAYGTGMEDYRPVGDIVHGALDKAIDDYMAQVIEPNQTLLTGEGGLPSTEGMDQIGFVTSFDGTPWGDVVSFGDLFSGGRIGPLNLVRQFKQADPEVIEKFQREFVALGLMAPPKVWGRIIEDPRTGVDSTIEAAVGWQMGITEAALSMIDERTNELNVDGTPYIDETMDRFIAERMAGENVLTNHSRVLKQNTINTARGRIQQYLQDTGRYMSEGLQTKITADLEDILDEMSPERSEQAFGQGGTVYERSLAENLLQQFYGTDDWGQMLTFGGSDRDQDYFNYAARSGAVSQRELDLLRVGAVDRGRYRQYWNDYDDERKEAEKDVAVASLLRFIGDSMDSDTAGGLANATPDHLVTGLNTYMHTVGARQHRDKNYSQRDLSGFAQNAMTGATGGANPLTAELAQQGAAELGEGIGGFRYRNLVTALNKVQRGVDPLRMRNV